MIGCLCFYRGWCHLRFYCVYFSQNILLILILPFIWFVYQAYILRYTYREAYSLSFSLEFCWLLLLIRGLFHLRY